jgi:hypothetical protein
MAGDWLKIEHATVDKPEVLEMADLLGTSSDDVFGKLFRVWIWFDQQSRNGDAGGVTGNALMRFIDRLVASQGFASCMKKVGWLTDSGIPNFDRHNGESAKNRALTRKRMKRLRDGASVTIASPEKRREEKTPIVPSSPKFDDFWKLYPGPRKVGRSKCLTLWTANGFEAVGDQVLLHVAAMAASPQWKEQEGKFIPSPLTYLNQRRFEDGLPEQPRPRLVI